MKTIMIRNVEDNLHKAAKLAAVEQGVSLNKWLVEAIRKAVNTESNRE